jgi:transposase
VQPHHRLLIGELLDHIEYLERAIHRVEVSIAELLSEQERAVQILLTLPATGPVTAAAIIAEIGTDMARFVSEKHLSSWALVCPLNKRSAGKQKSGATRHWQFPTRRPSCAKSLRLSPARLVPISMLSSTALPVGGASHERGFR